MKKLNIILMIVLVSIFVMESCANDQIVPMVTDDETQFSATEIADYLEANITVQDYMEALDPEIALNLYNLDAEAVSEIAVYASTGATAEEITVISVDDEMGGDVVKAAFDSRIKAQKQGFANYVPEELVKLGEPVFGEIGNVFIMVICDNPQEAEQEITNCSERI